MSLVTAKGRKVRVRGRAVFLIDLWPCNDGGYDVGVVEKFDAPRLWQYRMVPDGVTRGGFKDHSGAALACAEAYERAVLDTPGPTEAEQDEQDAEAHVEASRLRLLERARNLSRSEVLGEISAAFLAGRKSAR